MPSVALLDAIPDLPPSYDLHALTDHEYNVGVATRAQLKAAPLPTASTKLRTSHQDAVEPFTIIEGPGAWKGSDLRKRPEEWIYVLTAEEIEELDAAVRKVQANGIDEDSKIPTVTRDDFPLPTLGPKLRDFAAEVSHGRGFQIMRGVPVERYSRLQQVILWWGVGQHVGRVVPINRFGHLINHIHDLQSEIKGKKSRSPNTNLKQNFHSDQFCIDIVGMLAISKALHGGDSRWVSSITIHNELLRLGRQDLVEALAQRNFWIGRTGYHADGKDRLAEPDGTRNYLPVQPFHYGADGRLHVLFMASGYYAAQERSFVPRLSPLQLEAMRTVQALSQDPELHLRTILEPGDIQWVHNTTMMHTRDGFTDGPEPHQKRHLLRWWVDSSGKDPEEFRAAGPLPCFGERLTDAAGGWPQPPGTVPKIVLETADKTKASFF